MDPAVDAPCVLALSFTMLFPAPLMQERDIIQGVRQNIRTSLLPEFEGSAVRFEDFFCRLDAEVGFPFRGRPGVPEKSTILNPANSWNRVSAMPIKLNDSSSDALSQGDKGVAAALLPTIEDDWQLAGFYNAAIGELLDAHWSVEITLNQICLLIHSYTISREQ